MFVFRRGFFLLALFLFAAAVSSPLRAATFSTSAHPLDSFLQIDVLVGDLNVDPIPALLGTIGPGELTGTAEIDVALDGQSDGTLQYQGSALEIESFAGTFDLGPLGSVDYTFQGVTLTFDTLPIPVSAGSYSGVFDDDVNLTFFSGDILIDNAMGPLAGLVGTGTLFQRNYDIQPITAEWNNTANLGFSGVVDDGIGGLTPAAEASLLIPGVGFPIINIPTVGQLFLNLSGEVYVAVPEPSTLSLAALGFVGLTAFGWRKHLRTRNA